METLPDSHRGVPDGGQGGILALEPYHPAFKLNPLIGRAPLLDPVKALSDVYTLDVLIFHGENPAPVAEAIQALGGNVKGISTDALEVEIHRAKLAQLAALEPVRQIFEHLPMLPLGQESSATVQVGTNATNLPYNGVGGPSIDGGGLHCYSGGTTCGANEPATPHTQILMVLYQGAQLDDGDLSGSCIIGH